MIFTSGSLNFYLEQDYLVKLPNFYISFGKLEVCLPLFTSLVVSLKLWLVKEDWNKPLMIQDNYDSSTS